MKFNNYVLLLSHSHSTFRERTKDFPHNADPELSEKIQYLDRHLTHRSPKVAPNTERSQEDIL